MSLTSSLSRSSPVRDFFDRQFPRGWFPINASPLGAALLRERGTVSTVWRDAVAPALVDEMCILAAAFQSYWKPRPAERVVLNPTFMGSGDVGGADADLILRKVLMEIKSTGKRRPMSRADVCQLLGYVLLDYPNEHHIEQVGLYFPRRSVFFRWHVDDLTSALSGKQRSISKWRSIFRSHLRSTPGTQGGTDRLIALLRSKGIRATTTRRTLR